MVLQLFHNFGIEEFEWAFTPVDYRYLDAKRGGTTVWQLAGLAAPGPLVTAYTLSLDSAEAMGASAAANAQRPLLKVKLDGDGVVERVRAIHRNAPQSRIIVDANEAWTPDLLAEVAPQLGALGVEMIEQPLHADADLTEARKLADTAEAAGFGIMGGCMIGTSLGMAPATLVAARARVVDLDGPLILARDRDPGISFEGSTMAPPPAALWG